MEKKQPFKILSKICLNNWHYIDRKILTLNEGINFFTGHSGSGKSTVIDALQIVLYANTDGRGFFNKAAADDSDRNLIEYLRGMVNISENNESEYLRNKNFSTTIVLEFTNSSTKEEECVGVVFDVEIASNDINRLFFWHRGGILPNAYRGEGRVLSTQEIREYLQRNFSQENYYCGPSNERFRRQLYDVYLGGLDMEKFPRLFKRAIPFRMNIRLEDFVKEYICMEQDIEIEGMQESVLQYGRMRSRIESILGEIKWLTKIEENFESYKDKCLEEESWSYRAGRLEILQLEARLQEIKDRKETAIHETEQQKKTEESVAAKIREIQKEYEDVIVKIAQTGYEEIKGQIKETNAFLEHLEKSRTDLIKLAESMGKWKSQDRVSSQTLQDIGKFCSFKITEEELERIQNNLKEIRQEAEEEKADIGSQLRDVKQKLKLLGEEASDLKQGKKHYPLEIEEARYYIRSELQKRAGKFVHVQILADLLEVEDETWHAAVEGCLGNHKTALMVEPEYAGEAIEIYESMDKKKFCRAAVVDTKKLMENEHPVQKNSLAEEVKAKEEYAQAYINFLLGNIIKCKSINELRNYKISATPDCILYKGYRVQHINPENYTRRAYIGENSLRRRRKQLEERKEQLEKRRLPLEEDMEDIRTLLSMEYLERPAADYLHMMADISTIRKKEAEREELLARLEKMQGGNVGQLEEEKERLKEQQVLNEKNLEQIRKEIWGRESRIRQADVQYLDISSQLKEKEAAFLEDSRHAESFQRYLAEKRSSNYEYLRGLCQREVQSCQSEREERYQELVDARSEYLRQYPHRSFSVGTEDNKEYAELLDRLKCDHLEEYQKKAAQQAQAAVRHFKEDFVYKIRSAIKEAYQRQDELNRVISRLDFGKDKYRFVIGPNKGPDGVYYKMFMDDSLEINPAQLPDAMDSQMDLFTMEHEDRYGDVVNELIQIFIPPEHATPEEMEEAKRNMKKYSDYRTYLSFDMQQIVRGEKDMHIGLGKMIRKNSGGEGQNPLYVALLASFAQMYRLDEGRRGRRNPTIRLVILDEAFSKMDAEKVATCIELIRGLGFQAIISATNDKIQNYLENVDKTFVYANPDKQSISIMEFEKGEFAELTKGTS